jgi:hypothetical protein
MIRSSTVTYLPAQEKSSGEFHAMRLAAYVYIQERLLSPSGRCSGAGYECALPETCGMRGFWLSLCREFRSRAVSLTTYNSRIPLWSSCQP